MTTLTQTLSSLSLVGNRETATTEVNPPLIHIPAKLLGALESITSYSVLTPAIGVEFSKSFQLSDILALEEAERASIIEDLATTGEAVLTMKEKKTDNVTISSFDSWSCILSSTRRSHSKRFSSVCPLSFLQANSISDDFE